MATKIQVRRDTASAWTANSTVVLASGEIGFETDTFKFKIGNGAATWSVLPYSSSGSAGAVWGTITGTLSKQTNLQNALNGKADYGYLVANAGNITRVTSEEDDEEVPNISITAPPTTHTTHTAGDIDINAGAGGNTGGGDVTIQSGATYSSSAKGGDVNIKALGGFDGVPSEEGGSGNVNIQTSGSYDTTGSIALATGNGDSDTGSIALSTGNASSGSGDITIKTGGADGNPSGDITLEIGDSENLGSLYLKGFDGSSISGFVGTALLSIAANGKVTVIDGGLINGGGA